MSVVRSRYIPTLILLTVVSFIYWSSHSSNTQPAQPKFPKSQLQSITKSSQIKQPLELTASAHLPSSIQGYNVFTTLYCTSDGFVFLSNQANKLLFDNKDDIVSGPADEWKLELVKEGESNGEAVKRLFGGGEVVRLEGTTMMYHDGPGPGGYLPFYRHFAPEAFVPSLKALSLSSPAEDADEAAADVRRILFPRCGNENDGSGWKDQEGNNEWLVTTVFPSATIIEKDAWELMLRGKTLVFEKLVIVDRWAAHRHGETSKWGKMMSYIATRPLPSQSWFQPYLANALSTIPPMDLTYAVHPSLSPISSPADKKKPIIVYMDRNRQKDPNRLTQKNHEMFVKALEERISERAEVHLTIFENMRKGELVDLLSCATMIIGVRSLAFTDIFWMPSSNPHATVVEIFDKGGTFHRENQLLSQLVGLKHIVVAEDRVIPESEWKQTGNTDPGSWELRKNQLEIDIPLVIGLIEDVLDDLDNDQFVKDVGGGVM